MRQSRGFTLLELLVVLSIVAMTAGMVAPSASRWIDAARERGWRQDFRAQLTALPLKAFRSGQPLVLDASAVRALSPDLPASMTIELSAPLRYSATGVAAAAEVRLRPPAGPALVWQIAAVTGRVSP